MVVAEILSGTRTTGVTWYVQLRRAHGRIESSENTTLPVMQNPLMAEWSAALSSLKLFAGLAGAPAKISVK